MKLGEVCKIQWWVLHVVKNILENTTIIFGHLSKTQYSEGIQMEFSTGRANKLALKPNKEAQITISSQHDNTSLMFKTWNSIQLGRRSWSWILLLFFPLFPTIISAPLTKLDMLV